MFIAEHTIETRYMFVGDIQNIEIGPFLVIAITYHKLAYLYGRDKSGKFTE